MWLANVHLEGSPYRPNDRISQLKHALQRLEGHIGSKDGERAWPPRGCRRLRLWQQHQRGLVVATSTSLLSSACCRCRPLPRLPVMCAAAAAEAADVIICGDFNSLDQDSPCWLLRRGRLERNHTDACCPQVGTMMKRACRCCCLCAAVPAEPELRALHACTQLWAGLSCSEPPCTCLLPSRLAALQVPTTKETIAHPFALHEAYESSGYRQPFTRKVAQDHAVLDFIWCSRHMPVAAVMRPLQQELREVVGKCYLPNRWHPSDHLPVGAVLKLSGCYGGEQAAQGAATAEAPAAADDAAADISSVGGGSSTGGSDGGSVR